MVKLPSMNMDSYGLTEPTDVGNLTIEYDLNDSKKKARWEPDEVLCMLKLIKEHNLVSQYSVMKMALVLSQLMMKKGLNRTFNQIHSKIIVLRKNYLACVKQKVATGMMKECAFYEELRDIYKNLDNGNGDNLNDCDYLEQSNITFANDPVKWSRIEIQKMISLIKSMKLKNELTLTFFSPTAVRLIAEAMRKSGYDRSTEQVRSALTSLRAMYIDYKIGCDNDENPAECMFFPHLDQFWSREYKKCLKDKNHRASDDPWSKDETIMLLNLVQDLNIAEEAYHNPVSVAEDLRQGLAENGYSRPKQQIIDRLGDMKTDFFDADNSDNITDATRIFPFYNLYKKLFGLQFTCNPLDQMPTFSVKPSKLAPKHLSSEEAKSKGNGDFSWKDEEVRLLLKTVRDLTSGSKSNDFLEDEKLRRIVKTLYVAGYSRSSEQIKLKLSSLKNAYFKYNLDDSTEKDIFQCPFYNELHDIFKTNVSNERNELMQDVLKESSNLKSSQSSDHSYTNVDCGNFSIHNRDTNKVAVVPNNPRDSWCPVESIIAEEVVVASSSQDCDGSKTNLASEMEVARKNSAETAKSSYCDARIPEITSTQGDSVLSKNSSFISECRYDIAVEHEVITIDEDDTEQFDNYRPPDSQASESTISDNAEGPPCKKLRVMEDERAAPNKKFLLRPVDSQTMDSSALNKPKFVRLIVDPSKSQANEITAHIQPLKIDAATSVSSGMSSPVERPDILRVGAEKTMPKDSFDGLRFFNGLNAHSDDQNTILYLEKKISETMQEAVQSIIKHNESMQKKHQVWIEKQFEILQKHDEDQKREILNQIQELRNDVASLISSKQPHPDNQNL